MKNAPAYSLCSTIGRTVYALAVTVYLVAGLSACTSNRTGPAKGQPLRLSVGDIRELSLATRPDTTWQLTATSDNQEVVDVSRKQSIAPANTGTTLPAAGQVVFLIKGVTIGTANVVFSEKQPGTDGNGQVKKTYRVTVTSK